MSRILDSQTTSPNGDNRFKILNHYFSNTTIWFYFARTHFNTLNDIKHMNETLLNALLFYGELEGSKCMIGLNLLNSVLGVILLLILNVKGVTPNAL